MELIQIMKSTNPEATRKSDFDNQSDSDSGVLVVSDWGVEDEDFLPSAEKKLGKILSDFDRKHKVNTSYQVEDGNILITIGN
jgi:hypothetical protein